jgi:gliding motility-associated-like protein
MTGLGCDPDTSELIIVEGLEWAVADFDVAPDTLEQSIYDPTFSFINQSQNATEYWWDLDECNPQLPNYLLYQIPSQYYNPTATNIINYTYGCEPGIYTVQLIASNQGLCPDTAFQQIKIKDELVIYVPNTFTPDDDGVNDIFLPILTSFVDPDKYEFEIYDRWGERIFRIENKPDQGWDGTYLGNKCQDGTYTWRIKYRHILAEENKLIHGHVNLIR